MEDLFAGAATQEQEESQGFTDLPLGAWFIARTSQTGGAQPQVVERKRDSYPVSFKTGLVCIGGDGKVVTEVMRGGYGFFQSFIRPKFGTKEESRGPETQVELNMLNGRLMGFINALLSPGIEDKEARQGNSMRILLQHAHKLNQETDPEKKLTPEMFALDGGLRDTAAYIAYVFVNFLRENPRNVIINLKIDKGKDGDRNDVVVGSYKDAIEANAKTQKGVLRFFPDRETGETLSFYGANTEGDPSTF